MALPVIVAGLVSALITALLNGLIWLFKRLLISFGVGLVAYAAVEPFINWIVRRIVAEISFADEFGIVQWLGVMKFGECLSVIISAVSFSLIIRFKNRAQMRIDADRAARNFIT